MPFVAFFILNSIYTTFDSSQLIPINYVCIDNQPSLTPMPAAWTQELRPSPQDKCQQQCDLLDNDYKMKYLVDCENNQTICNCQATYWTYYINF